MKNLFKALAAFQQEVPAIHEGTKGYGYTYADLKTIFKVINPIMQKHNLGFTQLLEETSIKTIIFHTDSGETLETITAIPQNVVLKGMNAFQTAGSSYTYYRRYALSACLGLVTDVDSDAKGEQDNVEQQKSVQEKIEEGVKDATKKLNNASSIDELVIAWDLLNREQKKNKRVQVLKEELKNKLS